MQDEDAKARAEAAFATAVRAATPLWRAGCWIRAGLLAGVWGTVLITVDGSELPRTAVQLSVGTVAVLIAFAHTSQDALERLAEVRAVPGVARLADHLRSTSGRATVDASGLAEGAGCLLATWLFAGPFPLHGLPSQARALGATLAICYVTQAVLQAVIDPGWYSTEHPPSRAMRRFRPLIPPILAAIIAVGLWPYHPAVAELPTTLYVLLCLLPLPLHYLGWAAFDVLLHAASEQDRTSLERWRRTLAIDLHSQVKNPAGLLQQQLDEDDPDLAELRSLCWNFMLRVEDMRLTVLDVRRPAGTRPFGELYESTLSIVPSLLRERCVLAPQAERLTLSSMDYQTARRVLPDLVGNALRAGARSVRVDCATHRPDDPAAEVWLTVEDDAGGIPAGALGAPHASLTVLRERLELFGGGIEWTGTPGGTRVQARWRRQSTGSVALLPRPDGRVG